MAQIIRLRRGTLAELNSVTLQNGEIGIVTGSAVIGDAALKTAVVIGHTDSTNRLTIARIITGNATPDLSGVTGGSAFNNMLYHETDAKTLLVLNTGGNTNLDLTGNIAGREIGGNVSGSSTSTGSFGYLNVVGDAVIGGNLTFGDASTDYVSFSADISSSIIPDSSDSFNLGSDSQRWDTLYLSGSISASGGPHSILSATTIDVDAEGALTLDGGSITIGGDADVVVDIDSAALDIDASGAITIDGTSTIGIGSAAAAGAINIGTNATAREVTIGSNTGASGITLVTGTGGIDVDAQGNIDIDAGTTSAISLDASAASNFTTSVGALTLAGVTLDVDATSGAFNIAATAASTITTSGGTLTLDGQTGVNITEDGGNVIVIDTNKDVLFSHTLGSTSDPDVEFDGYVRFDGITEVANTTTSTTSGTGALLVDGGIGVAENVNIGGNLTVTGDYTVNGATTFISSSTLTIGDNIIVVNAVSPVRYGGIHVRDILGTTNTGSMVWDANSDYWVAGQSGSEYRVPVQNAVSDLTANKLIYADASGRISSSNNITDGETYIDVNDTDLTSINKLEGVDTNTYINLGDSTLIVTKGTIQPYTDGGNDLGATNTRYANLWLSSNADVDGYLTVAGAITGSTHVSASGNLYITGNSDLDGTLDVAGISDFQSRVDAQSGLDVTGSLNSSGQISGLGGLSLENFTVADSTGNTDINGTFDVQGISDFQARVDAQSSLAVTGSIYVSAGASVAATSASLVAFRNDANTQFGYLASADTQAVTTGIIAYNASTGNLTISSVIDGGSF